MKKTNEQTAEEDTDYTDEQGGPKLISGKKVMLTINYMNTGVTQIRID